jgi:hypothetical protein
MVLRRAESLGDSGRGALVDAGSAVDAFGCIDHGDIVAGDGALGADIDACSACDALGLVNSNHLDTSGGC